MNHEEAKLILHAYRPGGEDAADPIFADAVEQASLDPKLGQWFAGQRAFDEKMRAALQVELPPPELREALRLSRKITKFPNKAQRPVWQAPLLLTLAAILVAILAVSALLAPEIRQGELGRVTVANFTAQVLDLKESDRIVLGKLSSDREAIRGWLADRGSPSTFDLPPGLRNIPGLGCQTYTMDGTKVSLVCFKLENGQVVHLFVVDNHALKDTPPDLDPTVYVENGHTWATWTSGGKRFVMTGKDVNAETLKKLI